MEGTSSLAPTRAACARKGKPCVGWVEKYFKDCVCGLSDDVSFALGLVSLVFWAVAEIPQLVTNFRNKSGHGVSLALIFTWVVGDIFNLLGCLLEPATLPTQLYTALLYTTITVILVLQTLYYEYFLNWWTSRGFHGRNSQEDEKEEKKKKNHSNWKTDLNNQTTMPIPTNPFITSTIRRDMYYTSARSLASSGGGGGSSPSSYLRANKSGPAATAAMLHDDSSSEDESCPPPPRPPPRRTISHSAGYGTFLAASVNLPSKTKALMIEGHMVLIGRKLLQETGTKSNPYGAWMGWIMAAIYMGGRLPQIYLNIKRGSVEGLNPFMFLFALIANATYVGSILVRSIEWARIKANAPWLLDAIVCVLLDLFIIVQYGYYKFMHRRRASHEDDYGDYVEVEKPSA